jgi:hypothetical protein
MCGTLVGSSNPWAGHAAPAPPDEDGKSRN